MTDHDTVDHLKQKKMGLENPIALALTIVWLVACTVCIFAAPDLLTDILGSLFTLMIACTAVLLPLIIIWTAVYISSLLRIMQAETNELHKTMDQFKTILSEKSQNDDDGLITKLADITAWTKQLDSRLNELVDRYNPAPIGEPEPIRTSAAELSEKVQKLETQSQTTLPLSIPNKRKRTPITVAEFIKALNFPENADDKEGFRVLRRAFEERELGKMLQASQDVLTLLSQNGIYMDDLKPNEPLPSAWRHFALGHRGIIVSDLGGIQDRSTLTRTKTRLRNDPIFRDATHHFLRKFDQILIAFEPMAEDTELLEMSTTRTGRAFMLLGQVAGSFD